MGNHEWCSDCHESDFHNGETCQQAYPESYARVQKEKADAAIEQKRGFILLERLKAKLQKQGIDVNVYRNDGYDTLSVAGYSLVRAEKRKKKT